MYHQEEAALTGAGRVGTQWSKMPGFLMACLLAGNPALIHHLASKDPLPLPQPFKAFHGEPILPGPEPRARQILCKAIADLIHLGHGWGEAACQRQIYHSPFFIQIPGLPPWHGREEEGWRGEEGAEYPGVR